MSSYKDRTEGNNHHPLLTGHFSSDAGQYSVGLPGCKHILLAYIQLFVHHDPQVLLCRGALNELFSQSLLISVTTPIQVLHPTLGLAGPYSVHMQPLFKPVHVPLDCNTSPLLYQLDHVPLILVLSANLLKLPSIPLPMWDL